MKNSHKIYLVEILHTNQLNRKGERGEIEYPVPSAPAVLELQKPKSSQGGQTCCVCMNQTIEIIFNCGQAATCAESQNIFFHNFIFLITYIFYKDL